MAQKDMSHIYQQLARIQVNKTNLRRLEAEFGVTLDQLQHEYSEQVSKCPACGDKMADLGRDFKPPRKTDVKAWKIIEGMYHMGHCFYTCGCNGFGYVPKNIYDYKVYLQERLHEYESARNHFAEKFDIDIEQKKDALEYWADKIEKVNREIKKCGK
jgi:hypothetical protein